MKLSTDNAALHTQNSSQIYKRETEIENRKSAEASSQKQLNRDSVEIRSQFSSKPEELKELDLASVLTTLTSDLFNNGNGALAAQGNISAESVLALLSE